MSLRRYFKPANKLPTADKAGLSANVVKEVNQVVTRTLERSEASAGKKRKYTRQHSRVKIVLPLPGTSLRMEIQQRSRNSRLLITLERALCGLSRVDSVLLKAHPDM